MGEKAKIVGEVIIIGLAVVAFGANIIVSAFAVLNEGNGNLGFSTTINNVTSRYPTAVDSDEWSYVVWGVLYTWQALWLIYGLSFLVRPKAVRTIPLFTYFFFMLACFFNITWYYLFGNVIILGSFPFIILSPVALIIAAAGSIWKTYTVTYRLEQNNGGELWATRVLVHNGLVLFAVWMSVLFLQHMAIVAAYFGA